MTQSGRHFIFSVTCTTYIEAEIFQWWHTQLHILQIKAWAMHMATGTQDQFSEISIRH